ncbi:MAG: hypothetical protein KDA83_16525 [Planctomycetales bacterium]|nr:hypothetical protein [Planctomycetales bacterium]
MIGRLWQAVLGICVGTVLLELLWLGKTYADGQWGRWDVRDMLSIIYGIDRETVLDLQQEIDPPESFPMLAVSEQQRIETGRVLDFDMRERSLLTAVSDLKAFRAALDDEKAAYEEMRIEFESQLARLQGVAQDADLVRLRETLQSIDPVQAKDQIMALLKRADDSGDREIVNDVVVMIRTMPMDKRRKVLSEFQTEEERRQLAMLLGQIRLGNPEIPLIRSVRERLRQFDPPDPQDTT